jgi:hypothetical protein
MNKLTEEQKRKMLYSVKSKEGWHDSITCFNFGLDCAESHYTQEIERLRGALHSSTILLESHVAELSVYHSLDSSWSKVSCEQYANDMAGYLKKHRDALLENGGDQNQ